MSNQRPAPGPLSIERNGSVLNLILNRPESENRLTEELVQELHRALEGAEEDPSVHVVVLAARGATFCGGHDPADPIAFNDPVRARIACLARNDMMLTLVGLSKATIASVQGEVRGEGLALVANCDLAVAVDDAKFATTGVNVGLWEHSAQVALSRALPRKHVMELLLTGDNFSAEEMCRMGLINRVVTSSDLVGAVRQLAHTIAGKSAYTIGLGKYSYDHQIDMDLAEAYEFISDQYFRDVQSDDAVEGIAAIDQGRAPQWKQR